MQPKSSEHHNAKIILCPVLQRNSWEKCALAPHTVFMVHEIFITTTLGERSSPPGSVHMCKSKLIFKLPCPHSAAISRAAGPCDKSPLTRRTSQDTEIVAPWVTDDTKGFFWM